MRMTPRQRAHFLERSRSFYQCLADNARALGKFLIFDLADVRGLVEIHLARQRCPYCLGPLTPSTFVLAQKVHYSRGGRFTFRNMEVLCLDCQAVRGPLVSQEFRELMLLVNAWPRPVQLHFFARLRAGAPAAPLQLPSVGSLEWFTGSQEPHAPPDAARSPRGYRSPFNELREAGDEG